MNTNEEKEAEMEIIQFRLKPDTTKRLDVAAEKLVRPRANLLRYIVEKYLSHFEAQNNDPFAYSEINA